MLLGWFFFPAVPGEGPSQKNEEKHAGSPRFPVFLVESRFAFTNIVSLSLSLFLSLLRLFRSLFLDEFSEIASAAVLLGAVSSSLAWSREYVKNKSNTTNDIARYDERNKNDGEKRKTCLRFSRSDRG